MELIPILKGAATFVPFLYQATRGQTGGTTTARYCHSVWLRHLVRLHESGFTTFPRRVAELGPGDSLGIGLCALLCGSDTLDALDVVPYAASGLNQSILEELVELLRARVAPADDQELPGIYPKLARYEFPHHVLDAERLARALNPGRVTRIRAAVARLGQEGEIAVNYRVPWMRLAGATSDRIDLVVSQAVLEHVDDLPSAYQAMAAWLAPGGTISHVIDLRSHRMTRGWDGHLQYPRAIWQVVRGRRPYLLNRASVATHLQLMHHVGLRTRTIDRVIHEPTLQPRDLAPEFRDWSEEDRRTSTLFVNGFRA